MPILLRTATSTESLPPKDYRNEQQLEELLKKHPELLADDVEGDGEDNGPQFVASQVVLKGAGKLDLLFVNGDGLPIAVEVKLDSNEEARRKVIAQAIDYLSALAELTVDELNQLVDGQLKKALKNVAEDDEDFDLLWNSVGANLRAGQVRLVVAMNDSSAQLERIFRFLAKSSKLDVQLLTVQCYSSASGDIFVSRNRVDPRFEPGSAKATMAGTLPKLLEVSNIYDQTAELQAVGSARVYRRIFVPGWAEKCSYRFEQKAKSIEVRLRIQPQAGDSVKEFIKSSFLDKALGSSQAKLAWRDYKNGKSELFSSFPLESPSDTVAHAMRDLIALTKAAVSEKIQCASEAAKASATA